MKTTVEIPDPLLREARKFAAREGVTLRALIERGHRVVEEATHKAPFKLRRASFAGNGRQTDSRMRPGTRCETRSTATAARDRGRYQYSRLRPSRGFAVSRGGVPTG